MTLETTIHREQPPHQSAKDTTKTKKLHTPLLCGCVEFIYTGTEPYALRMSSGHVFELAPQQHFIIPEGTLARWCLYKSTLFTPTRARE